ncbi:MAG: trypsin-like peptidase domain-containing protein [Acidobacteriaceae bacterium]|nr:trypsin-like peptidase domain-containing protein [Acidobacteriaceae bacterium]
MSSPKHYAQGLWTNIRSGRLTTTFTVLGALSVGILAGSVLTGRVHGMEKQKVDSTDARPLTIPSPVSLSNGFSQIVKQVGPAVVNINTESLPKANVKRNRRGGDDGDNSDQQGDMQDFFNKFFGGGGGMGGDDNANNVARRALGSGFIVDPRGYILTNNHVVDKADHIYVKLSTDPDNPLDPGRPATVVGTDKDTDIAVIKIDPKGLTLPTVKLGNSEGTQVGDWVLAIGSPFGLSHTVSAGIVSAKNRSIDEASASGVATNQFQRFIQTDAAINPGNSGGPLVDMAGEVIGMNTAIYTQSMGSEGVGFAMPSNILISTYNMLIGPEHKVTRGSIGIQFQAAQSSAVGRMYGFANGGVMVSMVTPNGPASKAGLQAGDVIVSVDGQPVKDGDDLVNIISARHPGTTVKLGYLRNGKKDTAEVGIADRAKLFADLGKSDDSSSASPDSDAGQSKLGITVQEVPANLASKLKVGGGVVVTSVRPGSFADEIGLTKGSVITEINRHAVTDSGSYRGVVSGLKSGDDVVFVIHNVQIQGGGATYIGGTLP